MKKISNYSFPILLFLSIFIGGLTGFLLGKNSTVLKPLGDIFLNLIFTAIVPLIFFSVASAVTRLGESKQLGKIIISMMGVFLFTGIIAAGFMLFVVKLFPPAQGVLMTLPIPEKLTSISIADQIVNIITVPDFTKLLSHNAMLPLIFFSILVGLATAASGEKGKLFSSFLRAGNDIFMRIITFIMYYAPIGFFAYFAVLVGQLGPQLLENYVRVTLIYYAAASIYFIVAFTLYAYLGNNLRGIKSFWSNSLLSIVTSLATCSSAASIPANLVTAKKMKIPASIYETVVPLGAVLHKDGSVLGGIIKIAFLFGIFHLNFAGVAVLVTALLIGLLVGTVMGAIPSGGMLGEMLILSLYGFPPEALMIIAAISLIIDPLATMLNVTGNIVCSMMTARLVKAENTLQANDAQFYSAQEIF